MFMATFRFVFAVLILVQTTITSASTLNIHNKNDLSRYLSQSYHGGHLYRVNDMNLIVLQGSYAEMGRQYGYLLKDQLHNFYKIAHDNIKVNRFIKTVMQPILNRRYPAAEEAILRGVAETSGLSKSQLVFLDQYIFYTYMASLTPAQLQKAAQGCSTLAVWKDYTRDHKLILARNYDWLAQYKPLLEKYTTITIFKPNTKQHAVANVGHVGGITSITAVNDQGLLLQINSAMNSAGPVLRLHQKSFFAYINEMLFNSKTLSELKNKIMAQHPDAPYFVNIADSNQAISIEDSSAYFLKNYARARYATSVTKYSGDVHDGLLVVTNTYRLPGWKRTVFVSNPYPNKTTTQSFVRYNNLSNWAQAHKGIINLPMMMTLFDSPIGSNGATEVTNDAATQSNPDLTYYSIIYKPAAQLLLVGVPDSKSGYGWTALDLKTFFN